MDSAEEVVNRVLSNMGFGSIAFEPDGKIPPDFVIEGRIAVEVRRLTQIHDDGSGPRGLSEVSIPLTQRVDKLLNSIEGSGQSALWVSFGFKRPVPPWRQVLEPQLRRALEAFIQSPNKCSGRIYEMPHVNVDVHEASIPLERFVVLGGFQDYEAGGWVVVEFLKSISYCIDEKTRKTAAVRHKYDGWWLAHPDRVRPAPPIHLAL